MAISMTPTKETLITSTTTPEQEDILNSEALNRLQGASFEPSVGMETDPSPSDVAGFFTNLERRPEIIQGLLREGQILAMGGDYGVGKSPLMEDMAICLIRGIPWCGKTLLQRPVIAFDFESAPPTYKRNLLNCAARYSVPPPQVPEELEAYLSNDDPKQNNLTANLLEGLTKKEPLELVRDALKRKPNAVVFIDPPELLVSLDTLKKVVVVGFYGKLRSILSDFPRAAFWLTFNMRKRDRNIKRANLLADPRVWLEEVCGSLDLMNRADVRLGMDFSHVEEVRIINGVRRGEDMHPLLVRPVGDDPENLRGFEVLPADEVELASVLTQEQLKYWHNLPDRFTYKEACPFGKPG